MTAYWPADTKKYYRDPGGTVIVYYWYNFLQKYVTKAKLAKDGAGECHETGRGPTINFLGMSLVGRKRCGRHLSGRLWAKSGTADDRRLSLCWRKGEANSTTDTFNKDKAIERNDYASPVIGSWFKANQWTNSSQRALAADCMYWILEVQPPNADGTFPPTPIPYSAYPNATYDFWRHGIKPQYGSGGNSGKVAYNVLFCDGHVVTLTDRKAGYIAVRQKFPG